MASKILFLNHEKTQCGVYEIGKRIHSLLIKDILDTVYIEVPVDGLTEYIEAIEKHNPDAIIYNFYPVTMAFLSTELIKYLSHIKHFAIIHDPLDPQFISTVEQSFDAWMIHDHTNPLESSNKYTTFRPIPRYTRSLELPSKVSIGSHGFNVSTWKMFGPMIDMLQSEFDEVDINMNITNATFGPVGQLDSVQSWIDSIYKDKVKLNITTDYLDTEEELINFLAKNTMNVYFYRTSTPYNGVAGSADLAVASQSSLVVNNTYMYRHFHERLGYYEQTSSFKTFLNNKDVVRELYDEWSPLAITQDYKKMLEDIL